jgi:uncharacterized OB-fold protein
MPVEYKKPLPFPDTDTQEFWDGTKRRELLVQKCNNGHLRYPPRPICPECFSQESKWEKMSGKGEVYTFIIVRVSPRPDWEVPYVLAVIKLNEGPRMVSNVIGIKPEDVKIGMKVEVVYEDVTEQFTLPKFKPVA